VPNQLSTSKRRHSLAEHKAILAALAQIAQYENTTVVALLREGARNVVKQRGEIPAQSKTLRTLVWSMAPQMPTRFKTSAQVARFKRAQREFDQVILDLQLATPSEIQQRNSLISSRDAIRLIAPI
jgi:hypothetical protein